MRSLIGSAALSMVVLSPGVQRPAPQADRPPAPVVLSSSSVITTAAAAKNVHQYTIDLPADGFFHVSVSQEAFRISLAAADPDGAAIAEIDLPSADPLPEHLMFTTSRAGTYRIQVNVMSFSAEGPVPAAYTLRVLAARPATGADQTRVNCFATVLPAARLAKIGKTLADLGRSIEELKSTAACWREAGEAELEMVTLAAQAELAAFFTEFRVESAAAYERLIPLIRDAGYSEFELTLLDNLIVEYIDDGRFDRGRDTALRLRERAAQLGNRQREGRAYQRIGYIEYSLGNYAAARRAALAAVDISRETGDRVLLGTVQLLLGRIDQVAGDYDAALARYEQGWRANTDDRYLTPALLNALGFLQLLRGEHQEAARHFEARLELAARYVQRDTEALARVGLGDVRLARGDRQGALQLYEAAAETLKNGAPYFRCIALQRLGQRALEDGRLDAATAHFTSMAAANQQVGHPPCEAEAQAGIADVAAARGDLVEAERAARQVIEIAEQFREAAPNLESRALGFGALAPAFARAVDINMRLAERGDADAARRALGLNERALARGLLDHLAGGASDDSPMQESAGSERQRVRELWRVRVAQYQVAALSQRDPERARTLRAEMAALELQLRDLEAREDLADQRRARLARPPALELDAIQALLDDDTILIEYALGDRQSYMWVISSREIQTRALPPRATIEAVARAVHRDLTTAANATQDAAAARRQELSRLVLSPAESLLRGRRLVVVSAGALSLVPFAVLPFGGDGGTPTLLSRFEVVHIPSATTLAAMRALTERRPQPTKHTVVFADPIFEAADPRAARRRAGGASPARTGASRSAQDPAAAETAVARTATALGASFPRLPFSRAEANALSALAPGQVTMFVDGSATRDRVLGRALSDYRFIHFATHGVVHPEVPRLSSIVLSFVDGTGGRRDPFLTLPDIYEMRLNADIVVLSACSTGEGRHVPGEGPIGLARGFMYAGAPRVVASFWRVNDMATAELMKTFYRGVLVQRLSPAAALRAAQLHVASIPRWRSPYYWAPFVLHGDWR